MPLNIIANTFIRKLCIFLFPFAVVFGFPFLILWKSGEFIPVDRIVELQSNSSFHMVVGTVFSENQLAFKLKSTLVRKPEVLFLGSSRTMQFRAAFFKNPEKVYNAGGGISTLRDSKTFLNAIPATQSPEIILIGLDQWDFNSNYSSEHTSGDPFAVNSPEPIDLTQKLTVPIYRHAFDRSIKLNALFGDSGSQRFIGLTAVIRQTGFRFDGSHAESQIPPELSDRFSDTFRRIGKGSNRFEYGQSVSPERVALLVEFLEQCKARNIHVIAFLPPFPHQVWETLRTHGQDYAYMKRIYAEIAPLFETRRLTLFDFSDNATFGSSDNESLDGFHCSEKAYLRILIRMGMLDDRLKSKLDTAALEQKLANSTDDFSVISDEK